MADILNLKESPADKFVVVNSNLDLWQFVPSPATSIWLLVHANTAFVINAQNKLAKNTENMCFKIGIPPFLHTFTEIVLKTLARAQVLFKKIKHIFSICL